ncbi:RipA family octameric membrane protein [Candidatus Formimonas warabiya]|uniref:Small integral membrane protein n=1 Tax=Formimonas warabiya TaxID=1761012 RepID=A0A3G1KW75_FORW1|nr:hypothetical protein [Candidatus Formimonas warabiya]ATW26724.1 hypothetical protein DCMF_19910 [Candidatus Formimonas warabiya]
MPHQENQCKLFNTTEDQYGDLYKTHIIEQYKLYVEMMDRVSQRRMTANTFFITTNSALLTLFSLFKSTVCNWGILISAVGIIITLSWYYIINSYKQLNTGKFKVIHDLETCLPMSLYHYEWKILEEGKNQEKYWPLSHVECYVPIAFGIIYLVLFVVGMGQ